MLAQKRRLRPWNSAPGDGARGETLITSFSDGWASWSGFGTAPWAAPCPTEEVKRRGTCGHRGKRKIITEVFFSCSTSREQGGPFRADIGAAQNEASFSPPTNSPFYMFSPPNSNLSLYLTPPPQQSSSGRWAPSTSPPSLPPFLPREQCVTQLEAHGRRGERGLIELI